MSTPIDISDAELDELMAELETETAAMIATATSTPEPTPVPTPVIQNADATQYFTAEELAPVTAVAPPAIPVEPEPVITADAKAAAIAALKGATPTPTPAPAPVVEQPAPTPAPAVPSTVTPAPTIAVVAPTAREPEDNPSSGFTKLSPSGLEDIDVASFRRETRVTELNLNEAAMNQHGDRVYFGVRAAEANQKFKSVKLLFDILEAQLTKKHRAMLAATGEKVTEKMVETEVKLDPDYRKAAAKVFEAECVAENWKSAAMAMVDRREMIQMIAYNRRAETKGQLRIMEDSLRNAELENMKANAVSALRAA